MKDDAQDFFDGCVQLKVNKALTLTVEILDEYGNLSTASVEVPAGPRALPRLMAVSNAALTKVFGKAAKELAQSRRHNRRLKGRG